MSLRIVPIKQGAAKAYIAAWHRHHRPPVASVFNLGVADEGDVLRGVAMVGRPTPREYDDGMTLEVNRTATDGTRNANSMLYGRAWRVTRDLGYGRLITYTEGAESGASLRAAGFRVVAQRPPRAGWDTPSRPRKPRCPVCGSDRAGAAWVERTLWEAMP